MISERLYQRCMVMQLHLQNTNRNVLFLLQLYFLWPHLYCELHLYQFLQGKYLLTKQSSVNKTS